MNFRTAVAILSLFLLTGLGSCISERQLAYSFSTKQQDPNILGSIQLIPKQNKQTISFTATLYNASMIAIELHGLEGSNPRCVQKDVFVLPVGVLVPRLPIKPSHKSSIIGSKT